MNRWPVQLILVPLFLASCATVDSYLPWVQTTSFKGTKAATKVAEASITKSEPTDPEYHVDPWSFVLRVRNKTSYPLDIEYKVVFTDSHGVPTDVQYGQVNFQTDWTESRKALVPQAESSKAQVYLYLLEETGGTSDSRSTGIPTPYPMSSPVPSHVPSTPAPVHTPTP